jgi:hypothetical protein
MNEKITLELTREQARAVMDATELLARLEIGQFEEITWKMIDRFEEKSRDGKPIFDDRSRDLANAYLKSACLAIFGVNTYGWPDVGEKSIQHQRCWAVYAAIRYALAWYDHPEGGDTVDFGEPLGYGEPLPKCKVEDEA